MTEPVGWQFEIEVHPADWRFPAGTSWLAGWIHAPADHAVTDLRAWVDDRPFLGLWGLPRPDLDRRLLGRPGPPYAGFSCLLSPHRGASRLRLEVRDAQGQWHELFRTAITVAPEASTAPAAPTLADLLPLLLPDCLRRLGQRPGANLAELADAAVAAALGEPLNALPVPPFHGALEEPQAVGRIRYGRLAVTGWLAHRTARITRLTAIADALQESPLLHGLPRADVGGVFADLPGRETAQFAGYVDLPSGLAAPALLKVLAELDNGERHLVFAQRFTPQIIAGTEAPLPPLSRRLFARTLWALRGAAGRHRLRLGGAALLAASRAAWAAWEAEAPVPPRRPAAVVGPAPDSHAPLGRVLIVSHNLNFEGAPWFIFDLAQHYRTARGATVRVVAPQDGPMRRVFEAAGLPVSVVEVSAALGADSPAAFAEQLAAATAALPWAETDLVVANTMVAFWAVPAALRRGRPVLLYVHESSPVRRFFAPLLAPALFPVVEEAFRRATRVVFTAASSHAVFRHLDHGQFVLLPSWIDLARIDTFAAAHEPAALRRKHGLDPAAVLVVNIGTVCERKGQHTFLQAATLLRDELLRLCPGRGVRFVVVGARPGLYLDALRQEAALTGLDLVDFVPETPDIHDFYRLADVFVCTSFEESFPRVILESAGYRLHIVTTNVNGIGEMLTDEDAWLVPPGDRHQLAAALRSALAAWQAGDRTRPTRARAAIERRYAATAALPLHAALARAVINV
jgi:glycosyltransferase involved in cell wall biosynthesis